VINQIRALLLERGIAIWQGRHFLCAALADILGRETELLSPRMVRMIAELSGECRHLDQRIEDVTGEIEALAKQDEACQLLMTVPGIGPIIASTMVSASGDGAAFAKGRDFGAWLGLVPKQISTGGRNLLGRISKRGNTYLRTLFVRGARVSVCCDLRAGPSTASGLGSRRRPNACTVTSWPWQFANKLARIAWSVLAGARHYQARRVAD
jgi:transposase